MGNAECCRYETDLTDEEALVVLIPYYDLLIDSFVAAGFPEVEEVELGIDRKMNSTPRHFAGCYTDGSLISVSPDMADLPTELILGILAHELGHAVDFLNPARFYMGKDGLTERLRDRVSDKQWRQLMRGWKERDDDVVEFSADAIAEMATGKRIGYVGSCMLQALGRGQPRPRGLR